MADAAKKDVGGGRRDRDKESRSSTEAQRVLVGEPGLQIGGNVQEIPGGVLCLKSLMEHLSGLGNMVQLNVLGKVNLIGLV